MYCNKCGQKLSKTDKHCPVCGATYVKPVKSKPKHRRVLNGAVGGTIMVVLLILFPLVFGITSLTICATFVLLVVFGPFVLLLWNHIYFENDETFKIVKWFGLKVQQYKLNDIGYLKILPIQYTLSRLPNHEFMRRIGVYSKNGTEYFTFPCTHQILAWFEYYDIEIRHEYSIDS